LSDVVGFCDVLQQTPFSEIGAPPSDVILPPETAVEDVILETSAVLRDATNDEDGLSHENKNNEQIEIIAILEILQRLFILLFIYDLVIRLNQRIQLSMILKVF
jgi:hypothetical protein